MSLESFLDGNYEGMDDRIEPKEIPDESPRLTTRISDQSLDCQISLSEAVRDDLMWMKDILDSRITLTYDELLVDMIGEYPLEERMGLKGDNEFNMADLEAKRDEIEHHYKNRLPKQ